MSTQASVTNRQQTWQLMRRSCVLGAAAAIKNNNGRQQGTISSQTYKMKPCNESADVICSRRQRGGKAQREM